MEEERSQKKRYKNTLVNEVFGKGLHRKLVVAPMPNSVCSSLQE